MAKRSKKNPVNEIVYRIFFVAPRVGLEPTTARLTAACSTNWAKEEYAGPSSIEPEPVLALSIFPGRCQPSIVDRNELNYRVRNGNGWTLILISTNYMSSSTARKQTILYCPSHLLSRHFLSGDPYRIRTDVNGVRGRCLNHLTNGPWCTFTDSNRGPTD